MARLSAQAKRRFGIEITVRVRVHWGLVYLDTAQDDVYGLAANLVARVSGLAQPGSVVVSGAVEPLVRKAFEVEARPAAAVKPDLPLAHRDPDVAALFIGFTMVNWLGCPPDVPQLEDIEFIPCAGRLVDRRVPFAAAQ